jgi:transposase
MKRFVEGECRDQSILFPETLDEYVGEDNPVRVIDVFVDQLNLGELGFDGVLPAHTGRPAYHPASLLKIYIYGYLNRIQSSRRLEREARRNLELMWLTGRLAPDFKTIADFRRDNGSAICRVCREFVVLCRNLKLFSDATVAIDGSKFKAVNAHDRNFTRGKLDKRLKQIDECIQRYLTTLDTADRNPSDVTEIKTARIKEKIETLKRQMVGLKHIEEQLEHTTQVSLTDPDARAMATSNSRGLVGYNVQTAVETKHHLIVAHEVTNGVSDRRQLANMGSQAKAIMEVPQLTAIADRGYFRGEEIVACDETGITAFVPKPQTSSANAEGRFNNDEFIYDAEKDEYQCPAGSRLIWRYTSIEDELRIHRYWSSDCKRCPIKEKCTPGDYRRIRRWEHEAHLEAMQHRLDRRPEVMRIRRQTVEHPFGTIKEWMGATHFLTKTLPNVRTEMSLHVLAYNLKRVMKIVGIGELIAAMQA